MLQVSAHSGTRNQIRIDQTSIHTPATGGLCRICLKLHTNKSEAPDRESGRGFCVSGARGG
jgi:hypothetical protein